MLFTILNYIVRAILLFIFLMVLFLIMRFIVRILVYAAYFENDEKR